MLTRMKQWFAPPDFPGDEEKNRIVRLMNTLGLYFALMMIIAAVIFVPFFAIHKTMAFIIIAVLLMIYAISRYLMLRGQIDLSNNFIVIGAWSVFQGISIISGGISSPMLDAVIGATIIIGLLIQTRVGYVIVTSSILIELGIAILQTNDYRLPVFLSLTPLASWFWYALTLGFVFGTVNLVTRNLQNALTLARAMESQLRQEIARREIVEAQLRHQSIHDALTDIYNRTFFEEELERLESSQDFPVSVIIADLDGLKVVNDNQGHAMGDELLRRATMVLRPLFRAGDVLARIGGDEFAVILPRTDSATAAQMLARVNTKLIEHNATHPDLPVQLSLGVSTAEQGKLDKTLILADKRMYADKALRKSKSE